LSTAGERVLVLARFRDRIDPPCWSGGVQDAFAEQVEVGSAVHLPLDHFDTVDVACHRAELCGSVSPLRTAL
jgi:hypothetical protein